MATITKPGRPVPKYLPTPEEISAACDQIHERRLAAFDAAAADTAENERKRKSRDRSRQRRAAEKAAKQAANRVLLQQTEEAEPADLDHRDPRQTEQWIPVPKAEPEQPRPLTDKQRTRKLLFPTPELWRAFVQERWDTRREYNALAADADARGVLNYYNINRGPRAPWYEIDYGYNEMEQKDICNVDIGSLTELNRMLDQIACDDAEEPRYGLTNPRPHRDVRSFRSKRR